MGSPKRKRAKRKIKFKQSAKLVHKNDATRVATRKDTIPRMDAEMPRSMGPVFKVKIKKK